MHRTTKPVKKGGILVLKVGENIHGDREAVDWLD